jgi:small subunit ribosomal protein S17
MSKTLTGIVSSDKTDKTIVVTVQSVKTHPLYKKQYKTSKKFMAHDEKNEAKIGDRVLLTETRPLSARKRHMLAKILEKAAISADQTVDALTKAEQPGSEAHPVKLEKVEEPTVAEKPAKKPAKEATK